MGGFVEGLVMTIFGCPFLFAGLFTFGNGMDVLLVEDAFAGLFMLFFSLPFIGVGGALVGGGLHSLGWSIGVIKPKDPTLAPRYGSIGPESIEIEHPDSSYSGIYEQQPNIINGKDWYRKIGGEQRLYFYAENEGGSSGWSLDDRIDNGTKDWFNGGWISSSDSSNNIPFGTKTWNDVDGNIVIQEVQKSDDLVDVFKQQLKDSLNEY